MPTTTTFISVEGYVSPCVYLSIPIKGSLIPRIFRGKLYYVSKLYFGNILEKSILDIWNSEEYVYFRSLFNKRLHEYEEETTSFLGDIFSPQKLSILSQSSFKTTLPDPCKTCYKAYGI